MAENYSDLVLPNITSGNVEHQTTNESSLSSCEVYNLQEILVSKNSTGVLTNEVLPEGIYILVFVMKMVIEKLRKYTNPSAGLLSRFFGCRNYNVTEVYDSAGMWIETLPPRIDGVNGVKEFPITGINNILAEEGWVVDCNRRRNQKCEYSFEITNEYHNLAK